MRLEEVASRYPRVAAVLKLVRAVMPRDFVHGLPHVLRVVQLALKLAEGRSDVDVEVLTLAALLHDLGRAFSGKRHHAEVSAEVAEELLRSMGLPDEKLEKVVNAILSHSYSLGVKPRSIEAEILSDADKLDALGAIGIARVFGLSALWGRGLEESLEHFKDKILKLPKLMYTDHGRRLATDRVRIVEEFLKELERELAEL